MAVRKRTRKPTTNYGEAAITLGSVAAGGVAAKAVSELFVQKVPVLNEADGSPKSTKAYIANALTGLAGIGLAILGGAQNSKILADIGSGMVTNAVTETADTLIGDDDSKLLSGYGDFLLEDDLGRMKKLGDFEIDYKDKYLDHQKEHEDFEIVFKDDAEMSPQ